jgi:hypothetical protein
MRNWMLLLLGVTACSRPEEAPSADQPAAKSTAEMDTPSRARGREGDTLLVYLHHVKPGRQKEYEALMAEIWGSALRKAAAAGKGIWPHTITATRDLMPIRAAPSDSSQVYVYLIDPMPPGFLSDTTYGDFPQNMLMDAGYSPSQADSMAKKLDGMLKAWDGYARVQRNFSRQ